MVCAGIVTPYPPGVPLLCPGERVTPSMAAGITAMLRAGVHIKGVRHPSGAGGASGAGGTAYVDGVADSVCLPVFPNL